MVNDFYYYFYKEIILYLRLMQKYNNIKAVLFLFLFSIYLLHQSVPHFHHEHEEIANNVIEHSHDHDQNGNDIPEKNNSPLESVLDLFSGMHVHGVIEDANLLTSRLKLNQKVVKKAVSDLIPHESYIDIADKTESEKPSIYSPPEDYFNIYTSYLDSRGPPSLV